MTSPAPTRRVEATAAETVAELRARLAEATDAAREAYRHTTGLIRLLAVIGQPSPPDTLVDETLTVLSEVFSADVTCLARPLDGRLLVLASCGLPEDDPAFRVGWLVDPASRRRLARPGRAREGDGPRGERVPAPFAELGARSAAWIPDEDTGGDVLALLRHAPDPFTPVDMDVLRSVAGRLRLAVAERERAAAVERLAQCGHLLARHLDLGPLLTEAANLLRQLLTAEGTWVATVEAGAEGLTSSVRAAAGRTGPATGPAPAGSLPGWARLAQGLPHVDDGSRAGSPYFGKALLGVPVMGEGFPTAVLYATRERLRPFRPDAVDLAVIFANHLAVAMTNAELHRALRRSEATLRERATHDPLTGLANRVLVGQRLEEALADDAEGQVGLLFCDLDGFKSVNDRFGHEAGDHLLRQVAARLRAGTREEDLLGRFGGDEFVVVLGSVAGLAELAELADALLRTLKAPFAVAGRQVEISASIGGVLKERGRATANEMLRDADAAMFIAKDRGPGQVEVMPTL